MQRIPAVESPKLLTRYIWFLDILGRHFNSSFYALEVLNTFMELQLINLDLRRAFAFVLTPVNKQGSGNNVSLINKKNNQDFRYWIFT